MNYMLATMAQDFNTQYRPIVAYSPWVNVTIERIVRDILASLCAILGALKLALQDWPLVIHMLPTVLNETAEERLRRNEDSSTRSPLSVMASNWRRLVLTQVMPERIKTGSIQLSIERTKAKHLAPNDKLHSSLSELH